MDPIDWRHMPPLAALRALEATVRLGGFSQAARALNVTHAAIAQQVRSLEAALGEALVQRDGRGLSFTDEATALAEALNHGFAEVQAAIAAMQARRMPNTVAVTTTPIFAERWLMPRLKSFWSTHPDIMLALRPEQRVVDLRRERIDVGIRYGNGTWPGVTAEFLTSARFVVVAAPSVLAGKPVPPRATLGDFPWAIEEGWPEPLKWLEFQGVDLSHARMTEFPTEDLTLSAARQGLGLCVASYALIEQDIRSKTLQVILDAEDQNPAYYLVTQPGPLSSAARIFVKWLKVQA